MSRESTNYTRTHGPKERNVQETQFTHLCCQRSGCKDNRATENTYNETKTQNVELRVRTSAAGSTEEGCGRDIIQMCNFCEEWEAGAGEEATGHVAVGATATSSLGGLWGQESSCQTEEPTGPHGTQMESRETGASPGPPASGRTQGPASCWWPLGAGREHGWCAVHSLPRPAVCTGGCSLCLSRGGGVVWAGVGRETGGGEYLHSRAAA